MKTALLIVACLVAASLAKTYFKESFDAGWEKRWVKSDWKKSDGQAGEFIHTAGKWPGDPEAKGIQTSQDYRFYAISAELPTTVSNKGGVLVLQYSLKFEQKIDCGGGYIKLMPAGIDQKTFGGDTLYNIMFGPDVCGTTTKRVHLIFNYKDKNLLWKKDTKCETDQLTHVYTLVLKSDNTYEVYIDQKKVSDGTLEDDWEFLAPKEIKDPNAKKPSDWVDDKEIPDPSDKKPAGWDKIPAQISDPDAKKPDDWDEEEDGKWSAPMIDNPEYKGEWRAKRIPNPAYKGEWVHPLVPNPDYKSDPNLYLYEKIKYVGFELWQVKSGSIFDDIIVTDSLEEANQFADATWKKHKDTEKAAFDKQEDERKAKEEEERKQREEERKKKEDEMKKKQEGEEYDEDEDTKEPKHKKDEL